MAIVCIELSFIGLTNEGNEFFVGFFRNRFGSVSKQESIDPVLWITTSNPTPVSFNVSTIFGLLARGVAIHREITYVTVHGKTGLVRTWY